MPAPQDRDTVTHGGSVTPQRFAQVRAIFEAAAERPTAERRAFAAGACGGDIALLREVEAMLAADQISDASAGSSAPEEGRFPAGTVLAGRYRILGLLGHGGMGEVYKASDLILNQTVALKFLTPSQISEAALVRFRNEVRIARQVSHPNVCRVYDLGMVEGLHFLSMEYIDGEDLASLLRRIGRLPQDKAIEFTRKICAGLSAAHERGVLHRDLKPANIMIDGRGYVRITDFGLAGLAAEIPLSDLRSGTPAYMSPEQKAGKEVTTRSDIYSLGLVLHEMFTGKTRDETQSSPTELVKDLDPTIERLILRCLEGEPKRRPNSALNVAMALPGADPIAAALAAGETPSPEMVAASTEKEGFSLRTGALLFAGIVLCLVAGIIVEGEYGLLARAPLPIPPDALADRAEQLLKSLGYTEQLGVVDYGFFCCDQKAVENLNRYEPARREQVLASHQPPIVGFYYRWSPSLIEPGSVVLPPNSFPDGTDFSRTLLAGFHITMNAEGKLVRLDARPRPLSMTPPALNWDVLFAAAGLDRNRFAPTQPDSVPSIETDTRLAWTGTYADDRKEQVRVEAASGQGHPVLFDVQVFSGMSAASEAPNFVIPMAVLVLLAAAGVITAWRNLRTGRSDRRGAAVVAGAVFLCSIGGSALGPSHTGDPVFAHSIAGSISAVSQNLLYATIVWAIYIAIEPYVRHHWPDSLISWTRLTSGRLNNALVASHILVGALAAEAYFLYSHAVVIWSGYLTASNSIRYGIASTSTAGQALGFWFRFGGWGLMMALALLLMVVLLRLLLRRVWIADLAAAALLAIVAILSSRAISWTAVASAAFFTLTSLVWLWALRRFGLVSMMAGFAIGLQTEFPVATTGWFAGRSLAMQCVPIMLGAWALWVIVANAKKSSTESVT